MVSSTTLADTREAARAGANAKWSKRKTLAFIVGYAAVFWSLVAALVMLAIKLI